MTGHNYSMFFLKQVRSRPNATPKMIYEHFYRKVQQQQISEIKILQKALDLIEAKIRSLNVNVVGDDEEAQRKRDNIREMTNHLLDLDREIRHQHAKPGADFLNSLEKVLKFEIL